MIICLNVNFHYNGCDLNKRGVVWVWSSFVTPLLKSLPTPLESGYLDSELFLVWLRRLFFKHVVQQRPVLLITDGHKSHMTLDVIDTCC